MSQRLLLTGATGQLGSRLAKHLSADERYELLSPSRQELDLSSETSIKGYLGEKNPELILHVGAYTQVDKAESERELCYKINALSSKFFAEYAARAEAKMFLVSTDYVFGGTGDTPYKEQLSDEEPLNVYGKSKKEAEGYLADSGIAGAIIRTSWVFSHGAKNFIDTMIGLSKNHSELGVVSDQIGSPTNADDLALCIYHLLDLNYDTLKIIHATNEGFCSWYELCAYAFMQLGIDTKLNALRSEDFKTAALRPKNSRLDKSFLAQHNLAMPSWQDSVNRYLLKRGR